MYLIMAIWGYLGDGLWHLWHWYGIVLPTLPALYPSRLAVWPCRCGPTASSDVSRGGGTRPWLFSSCRASRIWVSRPSNSWSPARRENRCWDVGLEIWDPDLQFFKRCSVGFKGLVGKQISNLVPDISKSKMPIGKKWSENIGLEV